MGFLDLFRREVPEVGFDFDDLERVFGNLHLKSLAVDKVAEFVARIFSKSEFCFLVKDKRTPSEWDYLLNVRPNQNETASEFWQKVVYRLLTKNEVLIIQSDDHQLLVADAYSRKEYALYGDRFEMVTVKDYTFERKFEMKDVIFLQYNNNLLSSYLSDLFLDYEKLHSRLVEALARNNQIRGVLSTKANGVFDEERRKKLQRYADGLFKSFTSKTVAIVPTMDGVEYAELTNTTGTHNLSVDELQKLRRQFDDEVADILGIPSALLHGDMANLKNSQELFTSYCYKSLVKKISDGLHHALVGKKGYKDKRFVILGEGERDPFSLAEKIDKLISSGAMTRNEVRRSLGLEPVEGGDEFYITKNYEGELVTTKGGNTDEGDTN